MKTNPPPYVAHTPRKGTHTWHELVDHLLATAALAKRFAAPFGCGDEAWACGLWHDVGKAHPKFRQYLLDCFLARPATSHPHSAAGAAVAGQLLRGKLPIGELAEDDAFLEVALPILGHHGGLLEPSELDEHLISSLASKIRQFLHTSGLPMPSLFGPPPGGSNGVERRRELRLRMIYSALIDADRLDTERHFDPRKTAARGEWAKPADLWPVFRTDQTRLMWNGRGPGVNRVRRQVYRHCLRNARLRPGLFRLTVPTGGGKTRAGLAFSLRHAVEHRRHGFRRVVLALPYTSIIEQTATEYREMFGDRLVLEHQSQREIPDDERRPERERRERLAAENWDHPLIVTTTVQLFESLFSNRPGRCRKLHNLARSVLILDEVQTLPPELLDPTLDVLKDLAVNYGVTVVFCTATQPAFDDTPYLKHFAAGEVREIVPDPERFFRHPAMTRVNYEPIRWEQGRDELAEELSGADADRSLTIFNTRAAALDMLDRLLDRNSDGVSHLSTQLCGLHRRRVLAEVKRRLAAGEPVRVVSTQVVEAGVDLDFPRVYRALGPLDRIVQAAGRCNREGTLDRGRVFVFDFPKNRSPPGSYRLGLQETATLLQRNAPDRLHDPVMHAEFFQALFKGVNLDARGIQPYRGDMNYPKVAELYRLIEDTELAVIAAYDDFEGDRRLKAYLADPSRETYRRMLPYTVNLRHDEAARFEHNKVALRVRDGLLRWDGPYDEHRGLSESRYEPSELIA